MMSSKLTKEYKLTRWQLFLLAFVSAIAPLVFALADKEKGAEPSPRRAAEFARLKGLAQVNGSVPAIVKLNVPNVRALTMASVKAKKGVDGLRADALLESAIASVAHAEIARLAEVDYRLFRIFRTIPFVALSVTEEALERLEASRAVLGISEDGLSGNTSGESVGGASKGIGTARAASQGFDGSGWYVAVIDSGLRSTHEFFAGKDIVEACYSKGESELGDCPNGGPSQFGTGAAAHHPFDQTGHGTHVAGIAVGKGPPGTEATGVATGADLIAIRVFGGWSDCEPGVAGDQPCVRTYFSDQINALEYVFILRNSYNIASVNMSISAGANPNPGETCDEIDEVTGDDPRAYKPVIDNLREAGIATVAATGNAGQCHNIGAPACISTVVSVGSTDQFDNEAGGSNFHPELLDLFAPGVDILSSVFTGDSDYETKSGTSMAAPHVAGAWAILKQAYPQASVSAALGALKATGAPVCGRCNTIHDWGGARTDPQP